MISINKNFIYDSGIRNDTSSTIDESAKKAAANNENKKEKDKPKSFLQKIRAALQNWSNADRQDQEYDENQPIT